MPHVGTLLQDGLTRLAAAAAPLGVTGGIVAAAVSIAALRVLRRGVVPALFANGALLRSLATGGRGQRRWAVVTGASDGIGRAYAIELAKTYEMNVLLIARSEAKLSAVAAEIAAVAPGVSTALHVVDFSRWNDAVDMPRLESAIARLGDGAVTVLINNVGTVGAGIRFFLETDRVADSQCIIDVNVRSMNNMTHAILPLMKKAQRGLIINISSGSATMGAMPLIAVYAATKSYVIQFTDSLARELFDTPNVMVQCHVPHMVVSNMNPTLPVSLMAPASDTWARSSLRKCGYGGNVLTPYFWHYVQSLLPSILPGFVTSRLVLSMQMAQRDADLASKKQK